MQGAKPCRRKPKGSGATDIGAGLVGPKPRACAPQAMDTRSTVLDHPHGDDRRGDASGVTARGGGAATSPGQEGAEENPGPELKARAQGWGQPWPRRCAPGAEKSLAGSRWVPVPQTDTGGLRSRPEGVRVSPR